jgi:hypothetical protein
MILNTSILISFLCALVFHYGYSQQDWVQGRYYLIKGNDEVTCGNHIEKVVEVSEKVSAYREAPYQQQRGYRICYKRIWTKKPFKGIVYQWNEFRNEWEGIHAEGEFWIFHWYYFREKVY